MPGKKRKTLLITGAGGFVGRRVTELALSDGVYNVRGTDLPAVSLSDLEKKGATVVPGDITDEGFCNEIVKGADYVVHVAAAFDLSLERKKLMRVNHMATKFLGRACADAKVGQFVFCSTADIYDSNENAPVAEDSKKSPENDYSFSKYLAEQTLVDLSHETKLPVSILRPTMIYGPAGTYASSLFCTVPYIIQYNIGFMPRPVGGPLVNAVHVDDVAGALLYLTGNPKAFGEAYNISDDDWLSLGEFIEKLCDPIGVNWKMSVPLFKLPVKVAGIVGNIATPDFMLKMINVQLKRYWGQIVLDYKLEPALSPRFDRGYFSYLYGDHAFDNTKLKALGYKLRYPSFDRGYEQAVQWYKNHNWIPSAVNPK